jgi:uncharacterized phage protein (TIGR01671 family)
MIFKKGVIMRELKFRLWCKNKNEWEKDLWWIGCDGKLYTVINNQLRDLKKENHILMQYTGLHDKNGKEIYEGDMFYDELKRLLIVTYTERMACFIGQLDNDKTLGYPLHFINRHEIEIIGNVYENPELLK